MLTEKDGKILEFVNSYGGITINQASKLFYKNKYPKDLARKRLKILANRKYLKYSKDWVTNQRVYYITSKPSSHTVMLLNLYVELVKTGAEVIQFTREYKIPGNCRPDGFLILKYKNKGKLIFVEVDMQHKTNLEKYQKLYDTQLFQREYGNFPEVAIIAACKRYDIEKYPFSVRILDYKLNDLENNILKF